MKVSVQSLTLFSSDGADSSPLPPVFLIVLGLQCRSFELGHVPLLGFFGFFILLRVINVLTSGYSISNTSLLSSFRLSRRTFVNIPLLCPQKYLVNITILMSIYITYSKRSLGLSKLKLYGHRVRRNCLRTSGILGTNLQVHSE